MLSTRRPSPLRPRPALAALAASALVGLGAAGCGSGSSGDAGADPAAVVPANAALYVEADVHPQGDQRARVNALLGRILHTNDVGGLIRRGIDQAGRKRHVSFSRDIEPWLGDHVGLYVSSFRPGSLGGSPKADVAAVIAARDTGKAQDALSRLAEGARQQSYQGVSYYVTGGGDATGVVGDYVVAGTEAGFRRVVDTSKGSQQTLADADAFKRTQGLLASGRIGTLYLRPGPFLQSLLAARGGNANALLGPAMSQLQSSDVGAALRALTGGFELDAVSTGGKPAPHVSGNAAGALRALPGDAWVGVGAANLGARIRQALSRLASSQSTGGIPLDTILRQARAQTGIDIPHDVLSWMGDAGLFVRGTSKSTLSGALVVHSTNPALTRSTIGKLGAFLRKSEGGRVSSLAGVAGASGIAIRSSSGHETDIAIGGSKFVIAYGRAALVDALKPGSGTLGSTPTFRSAASSLGGLPPALYVDMGGVTRLVQTLGASNPKTQQALPYLRAFTAVIAGGAAQGGVSRARVFVGVR